ncbi:hypothetical protein ACFE04_020095 [Oxalis oulophora]
MTTNMILPQKDQKEKSNFLIEVYNSEKQLWTLFHSKGLLHPDVQNLYRKICCGYEKIFVNYHELSELQDAEFSFWKLHYKHIDEYRKRIKRNSASDDHVQGFMSFLSQATDFYQNLITEIKKKYKLPGDFSFQKKSDAFSEQKEVHKCQFLCYRFNICIGDLARYKEQYGKQKEEDRNWSVAATHYLEASKIWPDNGNPQNQLAVLATYVGDDFLALYHCTRSLAVKEPFRDAWNNLSLLFERIRSSETTSVNPKLQSNGDCSVETTLWSLFIRTMSFFFIESRLEDFPSTFTPMMNELDKLMALDDSELKFMLESYRQMDSARLGPFRALQVVSIFIFVIQKLVKGSTDDKTEQQVTLTQLALNATFNFMGGLVHRCSKTNIVDDCPLLPAVLVFVEWLVSMLDEVEKYDLDDKCESAITNFFSTFVKLLLRLNVTGESVSPKRVALWEDFELRGFSPLSHIHMSLDYTVQERIDSFALGAEDRVQRIVNASRKIASRSDNSRKLIVYEELRSIFSVAESNVSIPSESEKSVAEDEDEEEVIVFKPLTRYNSAPFYSTITTKDALSPNLIEDESVNSDDCLRRATSMLIAGNNENPSMSNPDFTTFKRHESIWEDNVMQHPNSATRPVSAGPPSLNAWVIDSQNITTDREQRKNIASKHTLSPIEEIASAISINECSPYSAPTPSAPLLPEDATWFNVEQPSFSGYSAPQAYEYPDWNTTPRVSGMTNSRPPFNGLSSSEWLRQYRENLNLQQTIGHTRPPCFDYYDPRNIYGDHFSKLTTTTTKYDQNFQSQGVHSGYLHGVDEYRRETYYERPKPYPRNEMQPFMVYEEKEWLVE